ncbi:hypothetical protein QVD17_35748 [Tagetes erecta]|uniref:Uncharacterized protein n=1 Tax=Tagetes erecta TaxID=13708 RepID=A0AAD8JSS1_TARER|nr:hypothetical protein QVD17_35748 [Tagetes erecta]
MTPKNIRRKHPKLLAVWQGKRLEKIAIRDVLIDSLNKVELNPNFPELKTYIDRKRLTFVNSSARLLQLAKTIRCHDVFEADLTAD